MATITVTTLNDVVADDGLVSLREAVTAANTDTAGNNAPAGSGADTIVFQSGLTGTVRLLLGELTLTSDIAISGDTNNDRKADITISGDANNNGVTDSPDSQIFVIIGAGTDVLLRSLTITNGWSDASGGAVDNGFGASTTIIDSTISNSRAASLNIGGGIANTATLTVIGSTITGNLAEGYGGGIGTNTDGAVTTIVNSTISGNTAYGPGAATSGGGLFANLVSTVNVYNSTITGNYAKAGGGAAAYYGATINFTNSILAGNTAKPAFAFSDDLNSDPASSVNATNSAFGFDPPGSSGLDSSTDNVFGSPALAALADNGGPVQTHALLETSPLRGAGNASLRPADTFDLDGDTNTTELLPLDATGSARVNGLLDIGALEADYDFFVVDTSDDTGDNITTGTLAADRADGGGLSLREAIHHAASGAKIGFSSDLAGSTIRLQSGLVLTRDLTMTGDTNSDGKADVTISGDSDANGNDAGDVRIFDVASGSVTLRSLTLTGGRADGTVNGSDGGAIQTAGGTTLTLVNSTVSNNTAANGGGIYAGGTLNIANSTINGNTAQGGNNFGGGIYASGTATIVNTTITGNSAAFGGGIDTGISARLTIKASTISGNSATSNGGGIDLFGDAEAVIYNSIVSGNTGGGFADISKLGVYNGPAFSGLLLGSFSVFGTTVDVDGGAADSNSYTDSPGLYGLADNGGAVLTMRPNSSSPAMGRGDNDSVPLDTFDIDGDGNTTEVLPTDARGGPRIVHTVDAGAVEVIAFGNANSVTEDSATTTASGNLLTDDASGSTVTGIRTGLESSGGAFTSVGVSQSIIGTYGTLLIESDGDYTYTLNNGDPDTNALAGGQFAADSFTYRVIVNGVVDAAGLLISVSGANDAPTANANTFNATEDTAVTFTAAQLLGNDTDADTGATLSIASVTSGTGGTAVLNGNGTVTFTPSANFNGAASFTYKAKDNLNAQSNAATVTVNVSAVNDAPVLTGFGDVEQALLVVYENTTPVTTVTSTDVDAGATRTYSISGLDANFFDFNSATGTLAFKSAPDFETPTGTAGTIYLLAVTATDNGGLTDTQELAVFVDNVAGNTIKGHKTRADTIDTSHGPKGKFATGEEDIIDGRGGDDTVNGGGGNDTIKGGLGKDSIDGSAGALDIADFSDKTTSVVLALNGKKVANATVGGTVEDKVKNVEGIFGGSRDDTLTGDKKANVLKGNAGNDKLDGGKGIDTMDGGAGNDTLIGGTGANVLTGGADKDTFVFNAKGPGNTGTLMDFKHNTDLIALDDAVFKAIGPTLDKTEFYAKAGAVAAHDLDDRIIYDRTAGSLYFDEDGNKAGGKDAVLIAQFWFDTTSPKLDFRDFTIV